MLAVAALCFATAGCVPPDLVDRSARNDGAIAERVGRLLPADALLLGEQHDAPEQHRIERQVIEALIARRALAALAIEMAAAGDRTAYLGADADETQVRAALSWNDDAWPWADYGPAVMAAVRAGIPVFGANLPQTRMKDAMADVSLDVQLSKAALSLQRQAIRDGHCGLLPETQIAPMTRIQIARDREMALTLANARTPGKTVLLISGAGHAQRTTGVPQLLPTEMKVRTIRMVAGQSPPAAANTEAAATPAADAVPAFDAVWITPAVPEVDHCAQLKARM